MSEKNEMAVMGPSGDTKTMWDPNVPAEERRVLGVCD